MVIGKNKMKNRCSHMYVQTYMYYIDIDSNYILSLFRIRLMNECKSEIKLFACWLYL